MERMNFVKDGVLRLPPGFRFHPTDEELVVQYLKRKVLSCPLPASIIPEVDVCKSDPWDLPGDWEQERYFFSTREVKYPNGLRSNRATGSGYWKATGIDKQIAGGGGGRPRELVGMKKTLVFYKGKPPHGVRTDWVMHEYRLASTQLPGNWVLCRVFLKKRGPGKTEDEGVESVVDNCNSERNQGVKINDGKKGVVYYDFMATDKKKNNPPATGWTSSGSSGVTEVSGSNDREDSSSSGGSFSPFSLN